MLSSVEHEKSFITSGPADMHLRCMQIYSHSVLILNRTPFKQSALIANE